MPNVPLDERNKGEAWMKLGSCLYLRADDENAGVFAQSKLVGCHA